jgi:murein DD-endopeptidase MepM/ murein hydrolase activator NlpD
MTRRLVSIVVALLVVNLGLPGGAAPAFGPPKLHDVAAHTVLVGQVGDQHPNWEWPVTDQRVILRPFAAPAHRYGAGHRGIDIAASGPVLAPADGVVHFAGTVVDRAVLSIAHPGGYLSSFEPVTTSLRRGDSVRRGEAIGQLEATGQLGGADQTESATTSEDAADTEGSINFDIDRSIAGQPDGKITDTSHCGSPCLHFGVRLNGEYVSPLLLVGAVPRSVLLPTRYARGWAIR